MRETNADIEIEVSGRALACAPDRVVAHIRAR